jgi:hypothetical protein
MKSSLISDQNNQAPSLETAVLFLVFNRPEATAKVFEAIRRAKPQRLYVAVDGARANRADELGKVTKVKKIATAVDWPCQVMTLFRNQNLGCKYAVSSAIDWFFQHEECGIILEDDVLPAEGFFEYCQVALKEYQNDPNVGMITGHSIENKTGLSDQRYTTKLSTYGLVWGWATWRQVWHQYDVELFGWNPQELDFLKAKKFSSQLYVDMWRQIFTRVKSGEIDTWDYQLNYLLLKNNLLCVIPPYNLIDNIGFGLEATHTAGEKPIWFVDSNSIVPTEIIFSKQYINTEIDKLIGAKIFGITRFAKFKNFIKTLIKYKVNHS